MGIMMIGMAFFNTESHAMDAGSYPVHTAVRQFIEANMPWSPETVHVDFLSEETASTTLNGNITLRVEPTGNLDFIGDMVFLVKFFKGSSLLRTESVKTRIEVLRDIFVSTRPLPAGTVLTDNDVKIVRKWVRQ